MHCSPHASVCTENQGTRKGPLLRGYANQVVRWRSKPDVLLNLCFTGPWHGSFPTIDPPHTLPQQTVERVFIRYPVPQAAATQGLCVIPGEPQPLAKPACKSMS